MLENDVEDLCATFTYETEVFDDRITQELHEGGFDTDVTEHNKKDYIKRVCEAKMTKEIERPIQAFLKGFQSILPKDCLTHLSSSELELIIAGAPMMVATLKIQKLSNGFGKSWLNSIKMN